MRRELINLGYLYSIVMDCLCRFYSKIYASNFSFYVGWFACILADFAAFCTYFRICDSYDLTDLLFSLYKCFYYFGALLSFSFIFFWIISFRLFLLYVFIVGKFVTVGWFRGPYSIIIFFLTILFFFFLLLLLWGWNVVFAKLQFNTKKNLIRKINAKLNIVHKKTEKI